MSLFGSSIPRPRAWVLEPGYAKLGGSWRVPVSHPACSGCLPRCSIPGSVGIARALSMRPRTAFSRALPPPTKRSSPRSRRASWMSTRKRRSSSSTCEERRYVAHYNSLMTKVDLSDISSGDQLLSASMGWAMERKEELVDTLWKACDMPPLHEFLDEHQPYFRATGSSAGSRPATALDCIQPVVLSARV